MLLIGHRGVMGNQPQNTIESFDEAIKAGFEMIELDVQLTLDEKLIVFHDDNLSAVTAGKYSNKIKVTAFDQLRKVNVHDNKGLANIFYKIPTLEEVLHLLDKPENNSRINIELKGTNTAILTAKQIKRYIRKGWSQERFVVSSFIHEELVNFKNKLQEIDIALLVNRNQWEKVFSFEPDNLINKALSMKVVAINLGLEFVNKELVDAAHGVGLKVNVYSLNTKKELRAMKKMGVDGIFANYQELLV